MQNAEVPRQSQFGGETVFRILSEGISSPAKQPEIVEPLITEPSIPPKDQLRFEGTFKPRDKKSRPQLTEMEKLRRIDKRIEKEIPNLRIVKKEDRTIRVRGYKGKCVDVFVIENDAILRRTLNKKTGEELFHPRIPIHVTSTDHKRKWWIRLKKKVNPLGHQTEISPEKMPEVTFRLRQHTKFNLK